MVKPVQGCESGLRESIIEGRCCAFDVAVNAEKPVLLIRGAGCDQVSERIWESTDCGLDRGPVRAIPQECLF